MDPSKTNVIVGPPGTGKTTRLLDIVEKFLAAGVAPRDVAFFSFTKKAAEEAKTRAASRFSINENDLSYFRTLHSLAFRSIGVRREQVFGWQHLRDLGRILGIEFKGREVLDDDVYGMNAADRMLFLEGFARNTQRPLKSVWSDAMEDEINWFELERFALALESYKKRHGLMDYNDMLMRFNQLPINTLPRFKALIVDEAQDLSLLQWEAVSRLSVGSEQVFVAGDDDQAIFTWSGADVEKFITLPGSIETLPHSYRLPKSVFDLASMLANRIGKRRQKTWSAKSDVGSVAWHGNLEEVDMSTGSWLLLARNGYLLNAMEDWCMSQGLSFHSINRDPLKSPSLSAIRVWENLRKGLDESAGRVLEMLKFMDPRFMGPGLIKKLKANEDSRQYHLVELKSLGLLASDVWHTSLTKIPPREREFFLAARRRGEPLLKEPRIKISTIHASKGGEADHVLLLTDMSYRCYNNMQTNPDDETRVWFVAATRCRQTLNLVMPSTNLNFEMEA